MHEKETAAYSLHEPKQHTIEHYAKTMKMLSKSAAIKQELNLRQQVVQAK